MPKITKHVPGTFSWADLSTTDAQASKEFYTGLFGWSSTDIPSVESMTYTFFQKDGANVAGLAQNTDQHPHWNSYISVEDVADTVRKAESLGGRVLGGPFDVMDAGSMAIIQDPQEAVFFLWQPRNHQGADVIGEPGSLCWTELAAHDTKKASDFYTALLNWKPISNEVNGMTYTVFMNDNKMVAGMFPIGDEWKNIPSHWSIFFCVNNCQESLNKAVSLGAHVIVQPTPVENFGCFAVLQDPQGAAFGIVAMGDQPCNPEGGCC